MKKKLSLLFLLLPLIASCGHQEPVEPSDPIDPVDPSEPEEFVDYDDEFKTLEFDEKDYICEGGLFNEFFVEVNMGRYLSTDRTYLFAFNSSYAADVTFTVSIRAMSEADMVEIKNITDTSFEIECYRYGDFILYMENALGESVYRNIVHVRRAYKAEEVAEKLYLIDSFYVPEELSYYFGEYRLSFVDKNPLSGILVGSDEVESYAEIYFTATYSEYVEYYDCYQFNIKQDSENSIQTSTTLSYFLISRCCDEMILYYQNGLLAFLYPNL